MLLSALLSFELPCFHITTELQFGLNTQFLFTSVCDLRVGARHIFMDANEQMSVDDADFLSFFL